MLKAIRLVKFGGWGINLVTDNATKIPKENFK
jgi:hypothetical protein